MGHGQRELIRGHMQFTLRGYGRGAWLCMSARATVFVMMTDRRFAPPSKTFLDPWGLTRGVVYFAPGFLKESRRQTELVLDGGAGAMVLIFQGELAR